MATTATFPKRDPEAEKNAAKKVAEMLAMPEHLSKVQNYRVNLLQKRSALEAQLKTAVQTQLEEARTGLELLDHSYSLISSVRNNFKMIDELCKDCQDLIGDYPLIKKVNTARSNLNLTLMEVDKMLAIPEKVEDIRKLLDNEINILAAHAKLRELERMQQKAATQAKKEEEQSVKHIFKSVVELSNFFESKLWGIIANCIDYAQKRPAVLVKALQIIEREEKLDEKYRVLEAQAAEKDGPRAPGLQRVPRAYESKCKETLQRSTADKFDKLFAMSTTNGAEVTIAEVNKIVEELMSVLDDVVPCFPPKYDLFNFFVQEYHRRFYSLFLGFSNLGDQLSAGDILLLVQWVIADYGVSLSRLGVDSSELHPPLLEALDPLIEIYTSHVKKLMDEWCMRIIETDRESPPDVVEGQYQTMAPVHLFESINTQFDIAKSTRCPKVIVAVVKEISSALVGFQKLMETMCRNYWRDLDPMYIIAIVNNNSKCYDFTQDIMEKMSKVVPEENLNELDMDPILDGFHGVCKVAVVALAEVVFQDLEEALVGLFQKAWYEQDLMDLIISTLKDYYDNDIQPYLMESYMRRFAQDCLERLAFRIVVELLTRKHPFNQASVERFTDDISAIKDFFAKYVRPNFLEEKLQVLEDLLALLDAESDMVSLYYDSLLRHHNDVPVRVVEILLTQREDLDKSQLKEAMASCRSILEKRPPPQPSDQPKDNIFARIKIPLK